MNEFETPDDEVCDEVREHRQRIREWDAAQKKPQAASSASTPKRTGANPVTPNEAQGYIESFNRLVAVTRTKYPRMTRQRAVALTAQQHPGSHELYLKALTGRPGVDRDLTK